MYFSPGHLEKHFSITAEDWKQILVHIDSKCRSAYRCKSRGLPQTIRAFQCQASEQTANDADELGTGIAETYSGDGDAQPHENSLMTQVELTVLAVYQQTVSLPIGWNNYLPVCAAIAMLLITDMALAMYSANLFTCILCADTHTHPFNSPFSGTTRVGRYQKGKTNLDFTEARDSEWQWHQLSHMQICTSFPDR